MPDDASVRDPMLVDQELKDAKIRALDAKAEKELALARTAKATADEAEIGRDQLREKREKELVTDDQRRVYRFWKPVSEATVSACHTTLWQWSRLSPKCAIEIEFCSPGGEITSGMALFDAIQELRRKGHKVTTSTVGMAASMAGILLQAGDVRVMGRESWLLIHQASFGALGSTFEIEDRVEWIKQIQERILDIFAKRAKGSRAKKPISRKQIKKNWNRKDWWISSNDALRHGLVDKLR